MPNKYKYADDPRIKEWAMKSQKKNYNPLNINLKRGVKEKYKAFAASQGMSITEMFTRYMDSEIEKAGFVYEEESADE